MCISLTIKESEKTNSCCFKGSGGGGDYSARSRKEINLESPEERDFSPFSMHLPMWMAQE